MLLRLAREYLRPYKTWIWVIVALQLVGTIASLYLPSLNADIIDNGVIRGDTDYIIEVGIWMLAVSLVQVACSIAAVSSGHAPPWDSVVTCGRRSSAGSLRSPAARSPDSAPPRSSPATPTTCSRSRC